MTTVGLNNTPAAVNGAAAAPTGIQKIQHVVVIMQENRSFDSYFGSYKPPAGSDQTVDGIPTDSNGIPTVCNPNPRTSTCDKPYVDHHDVMQGGAHGAASSKADVNNGAMDGFVRTVEHAKTNCTKFYTPECADGPTDTTDVMGYKVRTDIPNYYKYADNFVLQDHMYEPNASWSLPEHLFQVSGWSADCGASHIAMNCVNAPDGPAIRPGDPDPTKVVQNYPHTPIYAWTDLTYLLHKNKVSWKYYVTSGKEPDCENDEAISCAPVKQNAYTPGIWNPLPLFDTVRNDGQLGNIQSISNFYADAKGTLPKVSWVIPSGDVSEHPPSKTSDGQAFVTSAVNAIMNGPNWKSTAIFVAWDDWGGFYDHVTPPTVDVNGYGIRVPGLLISPYAKKGYIDHQTLSFDAYLKFIEDDFLGGRRIDPATDGRPDQRPTVREDVSILGDLANAFDFNQAPRPKFVLSVHPTTTLTTRPPFQPIVTRVIQGNAQATVQWQKPYSDGGNPIGSYMVVPILNNTDQPGQVFKAPSVSGVVTGLTNGQIYHFKMAAISDIGVTGQWSSVSGAITVGVPLAPRSVTATAGAGSSPTKVTWQPPSTVNGSPITSYTIVPATGNTSLTPSVVGPNVRFDNFYGLKSGTTYHFVIYASNVNGGGVRAWSNTVKPTP